MIQTKASGIQASPRKLKKKKCKNATCRAEFIQRAPYKLPVVFHARCKWQPLGRPRLSEKTSGKSR